MRFSLLFLLTLLVAGFCPAQDTSFQVGPQYLITTTDTRFLHPIATPSMALDAPLPGIPTLPQISPQVAEQPYVSNPVLDNQPNLFPIYYGYPALTVVARCPPVSMTPATLRLQACPRWSNVAMALAWRKAPPSGRLTSAPQHACTRMPTLSGRAPTGGAIEPSPTRSRGSLKGHFRLGNSCTTPILRISTCRQSPKQSCSSAASSRIFLQQYPSNSRA